MDRTEIEQHLRAVAEANDREDAENALRQTLREIGLTEDQAQEAAVVGMEMALAESKTQNFDPAREPWGHFRSMMAFLCSPDWNKRLVAEMRRRKLRHA